MYCRCEKNHFCFYRACTAKEETATKSDGSCFDGSEPATRWTGIENSLYRSWAGMDKSCQMRLALPNRYC